MPPFLAYSASATVCTAGLKPTPNAAKIDARAKIPPVGETPMKEYEIISRTRETRTTTSSKEGECRTFFVVEAVCGGGDGAEDDVEA